MKTDQDIIYEILSSIKLSHLDLEKIADQATKPISAIDFVNDLADMGVSAWYGEAAAMAWDDIQAATKSFYRETARAIA